MTRLHCLLGEAWQEFRFGLTSGIPVLVFGGIAAYMLVVMSSAGYMQDMAAADIPRNAPSIVYMMTSGCAFFLFFAWAWIFAQPVLRDRRALLHEIVLAAPVSLRALLLGRYLGALGLAVLLGAAQAAGFLLAPLLELAGAVPPGSIGAVPWAAMAWGWLLFSLPTAAGAGALYLTLTLRTRSLGGAFAGAAALLLFWMVAMALMDATIDPMIAILLDPSGYADVDRTVRLWTPAERSTARYPLTPHLLANRLIWGGLPLLVLACALAAVRREQLVRDAAPQAARRRSAPARHVDARLELPQPLATLCSEAGFQLRAMLRGRALWICSGLIALIGLASMFVHVIGHADGPMVPSPELALPTLQRVLFLVIAFIVAAIAGQVMRRDDQPGFAEMIGASPAPAWLLLAGRAAAVLAVTVVLGLAPALSAALGTLLTAPAESDLATPLLYQSIVLIPALVEIAAVVMLTHALIRPAGIAYSASILATFILVVNHETALVTDPLFEIGIPAAVSLSSLLGWQAWAVKLVIVDGYKLAGAALLIAIAGLVMANGREVGDIARRIRGPLGGLLAVSLIGLIGFGLILRHEAVEGGYRSRQARLEANAGVERQWLSEAGAFSVAGGDLDLRIYPGARQVRGTWHLRQVKSVNGLLHAELPAHFILEAAVVDGEPAAARIADDHMVLPLGPCAARGCDITLRWRIAAGGWASDGAPPWIGPAGVWLTAERVMPRLGFDVDRLVGAPSDRRAAGLRDHAQVPSAAARLAAVGAAPAGDWRWRIAVDGRPGRWEAGKSLDPLFAWSAKAGSLQHAGLRVRHDGKRAATARAIADDARAMQTCVSRRLGIATSLSEIVETPRGLTAPIAARSALFLPEEPNWDIAGAGLGRSQRRYHIARTLAAAAIADRAALRQGDGAAWLLSALPGAIGLLCVGDAEGIDALVSLMDREAERTALALNQAEYPVGAVMDARPTGWLEHYGPLASLGWTARHSPRQLQALIAQVGGGTSVAAALSELDNAETADLLLGYPGASDVRTGQARHQSAWRWQAGGWKPVRSPGAVQLLFLSVDGIEVAGSPVQVRGRPFILLDARPFFERNPRDNRGQDRRSERTALGDEP